MNTERSQRVSFKYGNVRFVAMPFTAWDPARAARKKPRCAELGDFQRSYNGLHYTSKRLPDALSRYYIDNVHEHHVGGLRAFDRFIAKFAAKFGYTPPRLFALGPKETVMLAAKIIAFNDLFQPPFKFDGFGVCGTIATNFTYLFNYFKARNSALRDTFAYRYYSWHGSHAWNMLVSLVHGSNSASSLEAHFTWLDISALEALSKKIGRGGHAESVLAASPVEGHDIRVPNKLLPSMQDHREMWTHHPFEARHLLAFFMCPAFFSPLESVRRPALNAAMAVMKAGMPLDASAILSLIGLFQSNTALGTLQSKLALREYYRLNKGQYTAEERDLINKEIRYL